MTTTTTTLKDWILAPLFVVWFVVWIALGLLSEALHAAGNGVDWLCQRWEHGI